MLDQNKLMNVLAYINRYNEENGFPPTVRDICRDLSIKSTATAYNYINRLKDQGHLQKLDKKKRAVALKGSDSIKIPLIGAVTAGQPILAHENFEGYYTLPAAEFQGDGLFLLRVKGESMIEAGIFDGDKIIVKKQESADDGDIVVAIFDDGIEEGATVKRLFRRDGKIILHPENSSMTDFVLDEKSSVRILGKVIGLLRSF